jgi:hypothetical protein
MFGLFSYAVVVLIVFWLYLDKYIKLVLSYDNAKKTRVTDGLKRVQIAHRIFFWLSPVYFITIYMLYKCHHNSDASYRITMMIMTYLLECTICFLTKKTLNKLNQ